MTALVNGIEIFYEKTGSGPALIMLHGNGESHEIFDRAVPLLTQRFTVYAVDSRGHGKSGPVSEFHYDDMAEDIRCLIERLGLEKPIFYGFSDGAIVGLLLACRCPGIFSRLIISGANLCPAGLGAFWLFLFRRIYAKTHDPKMKMMFDEPHITREMLSRIDAPTTVLAGSFDMIRRGHTRLIAQWIPDSRLKIIPFCGHGGYIVHKEKISRLILDSADGKI